MKIILLYEVPPMSNPYRKWRNNWQRSLEIRERSFCLTGVEVSLWGDEKAMEMEEGNKFYGTVHLKMVARHQAREIPFGVVGQGWEGAPSDSQNNISYHCCPLLPLMI